MKKLNTFMALLILVGSGITFSQNKSDSLHKNPYDTTGFAKMRDSLTQFYSKNNKEYEKMKKDQEEQKSNQRGLGSAFFGLNLDLIFGVGFSNANFDVNNDSTGLKNSASKTGPLAGLNINLNLLGFAIGTGLSYSSKGFTTNSNSYSANYMNIPIMFAFNFNIKRVQIDLAAGPYLGILLSNDANSQYTLKNIDLGIVANVQGTYFFNRFLGTLLGVKYEQGGLNNLLEDNSSGTNSNVTSIKTTNWFVYTGIKFVL